MSSSPKTLPLQGSQRPPVPGAKLIATAKATEVIEVSLYARRNPHAAPATHARARTLVATPPRKRAYLKPAEFAEVYGAHPAEIQAIADWAKSKKLKVIETAPEKRRVKVRATVSAISAAFRVKLNTYSHPVLGVYRGREGAVQIPSALYGIIEGVFGLDTRPIGSSRRKPSPSAPVKAETPDPFPGAFFPTQVAKLYAYPGVDGTGQNIAVFAFNNASTQGGYSLPALTSYFQKTLGQKSPTFTDVVVSGPGNKPGPDTPASNQQGDATGEVMLDLCVVGSILPGAHVFVYFTEFTSKGWVDAIHDAVAGTDDLSVISISYGNPENDPESAWTAMSIQAVNSAFESAQAKGITICCASGDDGSTDGSSNKTQEVDFPASSPWVLGVGGTTLVATSGANPTIQSEVVWNEESRNAGAGGGGVSALFSKPTYQQAPGIQIPVSANPSHAVGRGVPDVAALADPVTGVIVMHIDGKNLEKIGGTSAAAPLWASLIARLNQALNQRCGFLNPTLYTKCASGVLRDITQGNNGAYEAAPGWDACTGLGSPNGQNLLKAL